MASRSTFTSQPARRGLTRLRRERQGSSTSNRTLENGSAWASVRRWSPLGALGMKRRRSQLRLAVPVSSSSAPRFHSASSKALLSRPQWTGGRGIRGLGFARSC